MMAKVSSSYKTQGPGRWGGFLCRGLSSGCSGLLPEGWGAAGTLPG